MTGATADQHVFVSHTRADSLAADAIVAQLESVGIKCWIAPRDVGLRGDYPSQINAAIEGAGAFIVCLSDEANQSVFVRAETEMAFSRCPIFPVRLAAVEPAGALSFFLRLSQWTDAFGPGRERALDKLTQALAALLGTGPGATPAPSPPPSPPPPPPPPPPGENQPALPDEEALRLYIEPNAFRWVEKWRKQDVGKRTIGWNWGAFFLGAVWLTYRKLWAWGAAMFAATVVLTILNVHAQMTKSIGVSILCSLLGLGMAIFVALRADDIYRRHATPRAAAINREGHDRQRVSDRLRLAGGVSWPAALGTLFAWFLAVIVIVAANPARTEDITTNETSEADNMANAADAMATDNMTTTDSAMSSNDSMASNSATAASQTCTDSKNREITFTNRTGRTIYRLKGWSPSKTFWTDDLLGTSTLVNGAATKVNMSPISCACDYEFRAFTGSGDDAYLDYPKIDVCVRSELPLGAPADTPSP